MDPAHQRAVSVILTVKNDTPGCVQTLLSLLCQTRAPAEIVVVDGGSDDGPFGELQRFAARSTLIRLVRAPGANIARGRNIATALAGSPVIASTDCGCDVASTWLQKLTEPFAEPAVQFVAGMYKTAPSTLFERVVGLCTMRGQLEPVDPRRFNPSGRCVAYTKALWREAGGWPEWLGYSEDTLFDHKIRAMNAQWRFAPEAVVHWRPRQTMRGLARQFYLYGTGRGHTLINAAAYYYNLRNVGIVILLLAAMLISPLAGLLLAASMVYFYWWTFHGRAVAVARSVGRNWAYPLSILVLWIVLFAGLAGFLVGRWQRKNDPERFCRRTFQYLAVTSA